MRCPDAAKVSELASDFRDSHHLMRRPNGDALDTFVYGFHAVWGTIINDLALGGWLRRPIPQAPSPGVTAANFFKSEAMNTEKVEDHHKEWRTLWLAIAGVMTITLTWNVLMLSLNGISY